MTEETWSAVDEYVSDLLAPHDEALALTVRESEAAELSAATARSGWAGRCQTTVI